MPCSLLMFAGSLAWLYIGFCGACAQLSKRRLVPWRVCTKHLRASLNKQPQPCSSSCQLSWAAPRQGKAKSLPAEQSGKNSCLIHKSVDNGLINVFFKLYLKAADTDDHSVALPVVVRGVVMAIATIEFGMWAQPQQLGQVPPGTSIHSWAMDACVGTMNSC